MAISQGDDQGMMSEINVTPFVDVMLVLLVIFMITAPMMTQGVQIELPKADSPSLPQPDDQITISITKEGQYYIGKRELEMEEIKAELRSMVEKNPKQEIFLRADGKVPYEKVAELMANCTNAGISKIGMITDPGVP